MKHYLFSYDKKQRNVLLAGDLIVILLSIILGYITKDLINQEAHILYLMKLRANPWLTIVPLFHLLSLYMMGQYNLDRLVNLTRSFFMVIAAVALATLITGSVFFFLPKYIFGRQVLLIHFFIAAFFLILWRIFFVRIMTRRIKSKRLAVVGNGQIVSSFIEELANIPYSGFSVNSICVPKNSVSDIRFSHESISIYNSIADLLGKEEFDILAFDSTSSTFSNTEIRQLLQLKFAGKGIYDLPAFYKNVIGKVPLMLIDGRWLLSSENLQGELNLPYQRIKRFFDIVLSGMLLLAVSPVFAIIAVVIKFDSQGPVFFSQMRLGANRKLFACTKFRTMIEDAEKETGPVWSSDKDPRITRSGRFLRVSRLDELPQLWNIFKGEMSFVGPRPIREHFARRLAETIPFYGIRFCVQPGLTGWAQVNYDYAGSIEGQLEKFQYELFYIQNMSLFLDIITIIKTLRIIFLNKGK